MRWSPSWRSKRNPSCSNTRMRRWKLTGRMAAIPLFNAHGQAINRDKFRRSPVLAFPFVACFPENFVERSHIGARCKKTANRVADVPPRFIVARAAARHVQSRHVGDVRCPFLEDVHVERKIIHMMAFLSKGLRAYY